MPALASDDVVKTRLAQHGWAFVLDVASVGKTTLALRMATATEQLEHPTFYIDLAKVTDDAGSEVGIAMRISKTFSTSLGLSG